jgi:hypothetical protein
MFVSTAHGSYNIRVAVARFLVGFRPPISKFQIGLAQWRLIADSGNRTNGQTNLRRVRGLAGDWSFLRPRQADSGEFRAGHAYNARPHFQPTVVMKKLGLNSSLMRLFCTSGCVTSAIIYDARPPEPTDNAPWANYLLIPVSVPIDAAISPIQLDACIELMRGERNPHVSAVERAEP